jgi:hypothetical protein
MLDGMGGGMGDNRTDGPAAAFTPLYNQYCAIMPKSLLSPIFVCFAAAGVALTVLAATPQAPAPSAGKGKVMLFISTECPVAQRYTPRINALVSKFGQQGIEFVGFFPNDGETRRDIEKYMRERSYTFEWDLDLGGELAKRHGVEGVPTAVVLDPRGEMVYLGAIDDNKIDENVRNPYVERVLEGLVRGERLKFQKTDYFGCLLMPGETPLETSRINYAEHIAPILNKHCVECHRPGEVAPFSLVGYENARRWAPMVSRVSESRRMPPWKAVPGHGEFVDANVLTELQIEHIRRWAENGAPRGDASKEPPKPAFSSEWVLGEPHLVLQPSKPFRLEGEGRDVYRNFVMKTNFKETRYVTAMDVKPGNPRVVHHVIAFIDNRDRAQKLADRTDDGQEGYTTFGGVGFMPDGSLGGWAPGLRARHTAPGTAFELKPGATIVLQVHYHKSGKEETDQTRVGLYFAKEKPAKIVELAWLANPLFRIPPGEANHRVTLTMPLPAEVTLYNVMPHMHLLGRSMRAEARFPDGRVEPLIYIDDWDFNWQMSYTFKEPIRLPAGTQIFAEAFFDNSTGNPHNPNNPPKEVRWGEETTDEMFLLVAAYTVESTGPVGRLLDFLRGGG